jgi:putative (di)nucleoside polyphosphate hydrolase
MERGARAQCLLSFSLWKNSAVPEPSTMTDLIDSAGFRANVGIILMRDNGDLFLGGRPRGRGWQFTQGGIQRGEKPLGALYRELTEETGLLESDVELIGETRNWLRYRLPVQYQRRASMPLCIGQKQRWFLLRFNGPEEKIRFDTTSEPEFDRWRWVPWWTPVREVIYFKRQIYARALHELAPLAFPNDGLPPYPEWWPERLSPRQDEEPAATPTPARPAQPAANRRPTRRRRRRDRASRP